MPEIQNDAAARRVDPRNLRAWLHRIDEACAKASATPAEEAIRNAALAALSGEAAPAKGLATKLPYEPPVVERLGTLEDVTQAGSGQGRTDAAFAAGTAADAVTFS